MASGLGIARAFANEGCEARLGGHRRTFILDVQDREAYARVAAETEARLGPVSISCNNAGVAGGANVTHMTYAQWDWVLGINWNGVINGIQTFVPRMIERKVVLCSSCPRRGAR